MTTPSANQNAVNGAANDLSPWHVDNVGQAGQANVGQVVDKPVVKAAKKKKTEKRTYTTTEL